MGIFKKIKFRALSDEALMIYLKKGKEGAFEEFYRRYSKKLLYFFYQRLGRDAERAQDFLQELFMENSGKT